MCQLLLLSEEFPLRIEPETYLYVSMRAHLAASRLTQLLKTQLNYVTPRLKS
jgi:hypothetical protein